MKLQQKKIKLLSDFNDNLCEQCHKHEDEVGLLQPHRIRKGSEGGTYEHRNIKMLCDKCHKKFHANDYFMKGGKGKWKKE